MKLMDSDLKSIRDIIELGNLPGGAIAQISMRIQDDVDKGPISVIREQYALRGAVEKDIMKVQNAQIKIIAEQKQLFNMRS